jgi:Polyketide cyclase / dehydrase and lipid transport
VIGSATVESTHDLWSDMKESTAVPRYDVSSTSSAPVEVLWGLLIDGRSWPRWSSGLDELVEERSSGLDPHGRDGVGAVRAFRTGRVVTGERLTEVVEHRRLSYEDAFNHAMKDYRAVIELDSTSTGGSVISWRGTWRMKPGVGWILPFVLPRVMQRMADDLAGHVAGAQAVEDPRR